MNRTKFFINENRFVIILLAFIVLTVVINPASVKAEENSPTLGDWSVDQRGVYANDAVSTKDGGIVQLAVDMQRKHFKLTKTDKDGNIEWRETLQPDTVAVPLDSGLLMQTKYSIAETADGGFIIGGLYYLSTGQYYFALQTDRNGQYLDTKQLFPDGYGHFADLKLTPDGGVLVVAVLRSYYNVNMSDMLIKKYTSDFQPEWQKKVKVSLYSSPKLQITEDNGYFISGWSRYNGEKSKGIPSITKLDAQGQELWTRDNPKVGETVETNLVLESPDHNLINAEVLLGEADARLLKVTKINPANNQTLWSTEVKDYKGINSLDDLQISAKGDIIIGGHTVKPLYSLENGDSVVVLLNAQGKKQWHQVLGTSADKEKVVKLLLFPDDSIAAYGSITNLPINGERLIKVPFKEPDPETYIEFSQIGYRVGEGLTTKVKVNLVSPQETRDITSEVTYSVHEPLIVNINKGGILTGNLPGYTTLVKATYQGKYTATAEVSVFYSPETKNEISLDSSIYSLVPGKAINTQVTATTIESSREVTFFSSYTTADPSIAIVDVRGKITAVSPGQTTITATFKDSTASATIHVLKKYDGELKLNAKAYNLLSDESIQVKVTSITDKGVSTDVTSEVQYEMADPLVAQVHADGKINPVAPGTTWLTVQYQGRTQKVLVTVVDKNTSTLKLDSRDYSLVTNTKHETQLYLQDSSGRTKDVTSEGQYETANPLIAAVDHEGVVQGMVPGVTTLSARYQDFQTTASIIIYKSSENQIELNSKEYVLYSGESLNALLSQQGNDISDAAEYTTGDTKIAVVSPNGQITAISPGETTLTASYQGEKVTAKITVLISSVEKLHLDSEEYSLVQGQSLDIQLIAEDGKGSNKVTLQGRYSTDDERVATVDAEGNITARGKGKTTLNATYGDVTVKAVIKVY